MKQVVDTTDQMSHLRALVSHACAHSECEDEIKGLKFIIQMLRLDRDIAAGEAAISAHDAAQCLMAAPGGGGDDDDDDEGGSRGRGRGGGPGRRGSGGAD